MFISVAAATLMKLHSGLGLFATLVTLATVIVLTTVARGTRLVLAGLAWTLTSTADTATRVGVRTW